MTEVLFWVASLFIVYSYIGYPLVLWIVSRFVSRPQVQGEFAPTVSIIIAAHNEAKRIRAKLENTLKQDYPEHRRQIMVASDASTDETDAIVGEYADRGVILVRTPERKGKETAQLAAINASSGEILVFTDSATELAPNGVSNIVSNFIDPSIGCVSSTDQMLSAGADSVAERPYLSYEMSLRLLESRIYTLVGLSGSFFAARRVVCQQWSVNLPSDFVTLLNSVSMGYRGVLDPDSVGYYRPVARDTQEFHRRARTVLRGITAMFAYARLLNPFTHPLFAWQLASHKLCRWLVPFAVCIQFITACALAFTSPIYMLCALGYGAIGVLGLTGLLSSGRGYPTLRLLRVPSFFLLANAAIVYAWYRYSRGHRVVLWQPSTR